MLIMVSMLTIVVAVVPNTVTTNGGILVEGMVTVRKAECLRMVGI